MPNLQVRFVPITSQNRIPLLQNGTFDFECGSTTNNLERQQQVDFSNTFFIIGTRLLVNKDSGIKDFDGLKGKNVAVTSGTTSEKLLNKMNDEKGLAINIISVKDHGDAFRTVESGRAVAFFMDDALLAGERAKAKKPADWIIVGTPQSFEAYGCMVRKGDAQFKKLLDDVIAAEQSNGNAEKSFNRWFMWEQAGVSSCCVAHRSHNRMHIHNGLSGWPASDNCLRCQRIRITCRSDEHQAAFAPSPLKQAKWFVRLP